MATIWGKIANWMVSTNKMSLNHVRKLSSNIGLLGSGAGLFGLAFVGCNHNLTFLCLCISCGASGAIYSGWQVDSNTLEILITNTKCNLKSLCNPRKL